MVFCGRCGAENEGEMLFCWKCGSKLTIPCGDKIEIVQDVPKTSDVSPRSDDRVRPRAVHPPEKRCEDRPVQEGNGKKALVAVIIILAAVVLIFAGYSNLNDRGIPEDHPLYGVETPDGTYNYSGTMKYQGSTNNATLTITIKDEKYTYYSMSTSYSTVSLTQSQLDELNKQTYDAMHNSKVKIGSAQKWNNGYRTFDVYPVEVLGSTSYIATNGMTVHMEGETEEGVYINLTLKGWSKGSL